MRVVTIAALIVALSLMGTSTSAQDSFEQVHVMPFGEPSAVAISGDLGIYGITTGIMVVDISDPESPTTLSRLALPGSAEEIAVDGDRVFVAGGEAGVAIVDLASPTEPSLVRVVDTPGYAYAVAVGGDWIFVADGSEGLRAISRLPGSSDVSVVDVPSARAVAIDGQRAIVAGIPDVWLIDISDPEEIVALSTIPVSANAVAIDGESAIIGSHDHELLVFDLSLPAAPVQIGSYTLAGFLDDMEYSSGLVWVSIYESEVFQGLRVFDVSAPANPVEVGSLGLDSHYRHFHVSGQTALFSGRYRSPVVDVSDPANPVQTGLVPTSMRARNLWMIGDLALVGVAPISMDTRYWGIEIIDFADPTTPVDLATIAFQNHIMAVGFDESRLVVADELEQIYLWDISLPSSPFLLGSFGLTGSVLGLAVSGDHLFVADVFGFRVLDIGDPSQPLGIGFLPRWSWFVDTLRIVGTHVYGNFAASGFEWWAGGIWLADVSDPSDPVEIGFNLNAYPAEFVVDDDRAYVLGTSGGNWYSGGNLFVYDVSSSGNPVEVGFAPVHSCFGCGMATAMSVIYDHVIASVDDEIFVFPTNDLSNRSPLDLGHAWIESMATVRNHLIVADWELGLMVFIDPQIFVGDFETGDASAWMQ